jgi:uncharacterized protein (TIGR03435 family)
MQEGERLLVDALLNPDAPSRLRPPVSDGNDLDPGDSRRVSDGTVCRGSLLTQFFAACILLAAHGLAAQASAPSAALPAAAAPADSTATPPTAADAQPPAWDAATIKPSAPDQRGSMINFTPDGIKITNVPLQIILRESFGVEDDHIFGWPSWTKNTMLDIQAKVAPEDAPKLKALSIDQRKEMLISLFEDRCGLKFHHDTRELSVYELVVAKGGSKLTASKPDPPKEDPPGPGPEPGPGEAPRPAPGRRMLMMTGRGHIESVGTGMSGLAHILSGQLGRAVVDKTGLTGNFDYKLDWTPDDAIAATTKGGDPGPGANASTSDSVGPSLFTAVQEQLGLKLEAVKTQGDVIVIDQIEQPSAN